MFSVVEGRIIALEITAFKVEGRSSFSSQSSFCCVMILLKRCYRATRRAGDIASKNFNTFNFNTFRILNIFVCNDILYYLSRSHVMDTSKTFFAFLLVKHQLERLIAWQSASLVTCYSCILHQISCLKSDHTAVINCFGCGGSGRYKHQAELVPEKACSLKTFLII